MSGSYSSKRLAMLLAAALTLALLFGLAPAVDAGDVEIACGAKHWYFAEGYTGGDFDTWILVQNPNNENIEVEMKFMLNEGEPVIKSYQVGAMTRFSLFLNSLPELAGKEVSTMLTVKYAEGEPKASHYAKAVAERAMYFNYEGRAGGHASIGANGVSWSWYVPEGYTGGAFDTYVLLMNPQDKKAENVWVKLMKPEDGKYYSFKTDVEAHSRKTIKVDDLVYYEGEENRIAEMHVKPHPDDGERPEPVKFDNTDVSVWVTGAPLIVESAMYYDYYGKAGGSASLAAPKAAPTWYLPEGYTGGDFDTWITVMNPSWQAVDITYTFFTNNPGAEPIKVVHENVKPYSRDTICVDNVEGLSATEVATMVTATRNVKLEKSDAEGDVGLYALLYAIDEYDTEEFCDPYRKMSMYEIKHRLVDRCGYLYKGENTWIRYRSDKHVTLDNIICDIKELENSMKDGDRAVLYFGLKAQMITETAESEENDDSNGAQFRLFGKPDASSAGGGDTLEEVWLTDAELAGLLEGLDKGKYLIMLESDHAAAFIPELSCEDRVIMASCGEDEKSHSFPDSVYEEKGKDDRGKSTFVYYWNEGIRKKDADKNNSNTVSAQELFEYLEPRVTEFVRDNAEGSPSQIPVIDDNVEGEFELSVEKVPADIVAARSVYFNYGVSNDGAMSVGATEPKCSWALAEGYTGGAFDTYICVMNPYNNWQKITMEFSLPHLPESGPIVKDYYVAPRSRLTVKVDDQDPALESSDVSTRVKAQACEPQDGSGSEAATLRSGVIAERAMYFVYKDPIDGSLRSGGSSSIGYGE